MLELKNITKVYDPGTVTETTLFKNFNLTVQDGQFVSVVGSNGSGKTSLLNIICGSLPVEGGSVSIGGRDITKVKEFRRHTRIGRVYQSLHGHLPQPDYFPENLSLADNKGKPFGLTPAVNRKRVEEYRAQLADLKLGLEDKLHVKMGSLSGGQRQAVAMVMVTMSPLDFLILDEHTAALDPRTAEIIMQLTGRIIAEKKLTAIMVTHNLRYAIEYGDRLLMMDRGGIVLDLAGEEKQKACVDDVLEVFNQISIECGN